jgi:rubrerythrin
MTSGAQSRREALRRAALGAAALAAAGLLRPGRAAAQAANTDDLRDFLAEAIGLEQIAALAYAIAAGANDVSGDLKATLELFRDQEQAHANALRSAIDEIGFDPPEPPDSPADTAVFDGVDGIDSATAAHLSDLLGGLAGLTKRDELLGYLAKLEGEQLGYYLGAGPGVDSEDLSTTSAEICGCQAQHLYELQRQLGDNPADALVAAREAATVSAK